MLGVLSLGVCIACISCVCCLWTATVVTARGPIDPRTGLLLCGRQRRDDLERKSEEIFRVDTKKNVCNRNDNTSNGTESESCPCAITYVLDPILQTRKSTEKCGKSTGNRKYCGCPSFLDLVDDSPGLSGRVLPRS